MFHFNLNMRNTLTGETRQLTLRARDACAALSYAWKRLDKESGDRSWCLDSYTREDF